MAIYERLWDCEHCGTKRIKGRYKFCSVCGAQRPAEVVFYKNTLEDDVVTDPSQLAQALAGPDRTCPACGQDNGADVKFCGHCGSPMDGAAARPTRVQGLDEIPTSGDLPIPVAHHIEPADAMPELLEPPVRLPASPTIDLGATFSGLLPWIGGGLLVLALIVLGYFWFKTKDVPLTVTGFSWSRTVNIEVFKTVSESGWSTPADARNVRSEQRVKGTHQEPDGYTTEKEPYQVQTGEHKCGEIDLGNGYSKDKMCPTYETRYKDVQVPKYKTVEDYAPWYTYEVDRWVPERSAASSGNDHNPYDPTFSLSSNERTAGGAQTYQAAFTTQDEKKTYIMVLEYATWAGLTKGQKVTGKVNSFGALIGITPSK